MSFAEDQQQYAEMYFDFERTRTRVVELLRLVQDANTELCHTYFEDDKRVSEGKKPIQRISLDVATRAAISSALIQLIPQLGQILQNLDAGQSACSILCPALQTSNTIQ
jgi:hypothetical protein